ncbi:apolipoprotein L4-like isoform X2 [Acipenser ruthenus]|nr:apolipoprotein L4-like isoform X2 [Acipenser ruthenus]
MERREMELRKMEEDLKEMKLREMEEEQREMEERRMKWAMENWLRVIEKTLKREMEEKLRKMWWWNKKEFEKKLSEIKKTLEEKIEKTPSEIKATWKIMEKKLRQLKEERMRKVEEELNSMDPEEACRIRKLLKDFVQEYEKEKQEIEKLLTELSGIADELDKVDRDCNIAKTAGSTAGVVGGVLTIVGIGLAPVTAGVSLGLTIAGVATGVAGSVTGGGAQIGKHVIDGKANNRVMEIMQIIHSKIKALIKKCKIALPQCNWNKDDDALTSNVKTCLSAVAAGLVDADVVAAADAVIDAAVSLDGGVDVNPNPNDEGAAVAGAAVGVGIAVANGSKLATSLVDDAAAVAFKSAGRVVGSVASGVFVVWDAVQIGLNAKKLFEGSPTERAQEIRKLVETEELELVKLEEVNCDIKNIL